MRVFAHPQMTRPNWMPLLKVIKGKTRVPGMDASQFSKSGMHVRVAS